MTFKLPEHDFDPIYGNVIHISGEDPEADKAWDQMIEAEEKEKEALGISLERKHAERLGVLKEFETFVAEGRFREFMPRLNYLKLREEMKIQRKAYFCFGMVVGALIVAILYSL